MQQPPGDAPPPIDRDLGDAMATSGGPQHPRWALLSCLGCIVLTAAGGVLWNLLPCFSALGLGSLCRPNGLPGVLQVALVALLFVLGWMVAYTFGHGLQEPRPRRGDGEPLLRTLSDVETLLPLTAMFGGFGAVLGIGSLLLGRAQPGVVAVALLPAVVAIWTFVYQSPARPAPSTVEERVAEAQARRASPWFRFRSLPLIRSLFPPRPPAAPRDQP